MIRQALIQRVWARYESLTPRQKDVMALVVAGFLNKEVGGELGIAEATVKAHRGRVMGKMRADSLPALVHMATAIKPEAISLDSKIVSDFHQRD
jgi:FixJ family two-component response regulator